jgi:hypothetical protein
MISALRRSQVATVLAGVVLLAIVPMTALPLLHEAGDDPLCYPSAVEHDAAAHTITADAPAPDLQHCFVCHWWQSFRATNGAGAQVAPLIDARAITFSPEPPLTPAAALSRPARAPPVT